MCIKYVFLKKRLQTLTSTQGEEAQRMHHPLWQKMNLN